MDQDLIAKYVNELLTLTTRIDPGTLVFSYDHDSDTLMVHLYGRGIPGVSVPVADGWMLRLNRETDELIGVQIENLLAGAARKQPRLLRVLDAAELRGITPDEIDRVRREVDAPTPSDALRLVVESFPTLALVAG
ncbi:MAG TPA: hypothetical protein VKB09_00425 [Thermomicrobiales bacterium]|nr:hypothetical protein [Thermomicrobiales bacterium]